MKPPLVDEENANPHQEGFADGEPAAGTCAWVGASGQLRLGACGSGAQNMSNQISFAIMMPYRC
jgi:hypothetical protein